MAAISSTSSIERRGRFWLVLLIVACLISDGSMVPVITFMTGPPQGAAAILLAGIVGCVLAQGCVLAAWLAWSTGSTPRRFPAKPDQRACFVPGFWRVWQ